MNSLVEYIEKYALQKPEHPFIIHGDTTITYEKANKQVQALSGHFEKSGLKAGQTVGILMQNCPEFVISYLAILNSGANAALLPWTMPESEVAILATTVRTDYLIFSDQFQNYIDQIRDLCNHPIQYFVHGRETDDNAINIYDFINDSVKSRKRNQANLKNNAVILFSAGDYSHPKSLVYNHGNLICTARAIEEQFPGHYQFSFYTSLPFFHFFPFALALNQAIYSGNTLVIPFDDSREALYTSIEKYRINTFLSTTGFIEELVNEKNPESDRLASIDYFIAVGNSISIEVKNTIFKRYSARVVEAFGVAEAPVITLNMNTNDIHSKTVGKPISCCEIAVMDDDGNEVMENQPGKLMVRGENVFHHYFDQYPIADRDSEEWISTGDIVKKDSDGFLYWLCKQSDCFYRNGFFEIPGTITEILLKHPKIQEVTILVTNGRYRHNYITAAITLNEPLNNGELSEYFNQTLPRYLIPDSVEIVDHFDYNCIGIIIKSHVKSIVN